MVVMCLVYAGCKKEELPLNSKNDIQGTESTIVKKNKGNIIVLSSNINNPYDTIGQSHNQQLDEWIAGILDIVEEVPDSINYFYLSANEYMNNFSVEDSLANAVIDSIQGNLINITYGTQISTTLSTVLETQAAIDYISNLETIMTPTYSNNRNIEDHTDLIIDLEEDVINDVVIPSEEKSNYIDGHFSFST